MNAYQHFTQQLGIRLPIIGGPMYPCSNPELVAAVSEAGGIGIIQPLSLTYVYGHDFREGIRLIKSLTQKPVGMNALIEKSSEKYRQRMEEWIEIALEEGIRFFITSLGKPDWVVKKVHAVNGLVYHDATEAKWAQKGIDCGVDGLIAVNNRAGGHAGNLGIDKLYQELSQFNCPIVCAGGIGSAQEFKQALDLGYCGVQMGTRFIASQECDVDDSYKAAIVDAQEKDVVLTERMTGVPVSVLRTDYVKKTGTQPGLLARWLLKHKSTKHLMRVVYALKSLHSLKRTIRGDRNGFWQAGKSVQNITDIQPVSQIMQDFAKTLPE